MGISGHFNKIINIYFLDSNGNKTKDKIICPTLGRKPEIEIVGTFMCSDGGNIPSFTITVTNLYINVIEFQYPQILVEAGYKNNLISFKGSIISLFQESPGPDGKTVICCYLGTVQKWLDGEQLDVSFDAGTTLKSVIENISTALKFTTIPQIPAELQKLTLPVAFAENGSGSYLFNKIFKLFPDYKLQISELNNQLYVYSTGSVQSTQKTIQIDYLSSPPQKNPGDEDTPYYIVFTAPWDPAVMPGVTVKFPAWSYIKYLTTVNTLTETNAAIVQFVQVHFSTVGSVNQMQVQGIGVTNV